MTEMTLPAWKIFRGTDLAQGDILLDCKVPCFSAELEGNQEEQSVVVQHRDLILITQSCDLANSKVPFAALCTIHKLDTLEQVNTAFAKKGRWEEVRKGRVEGLHMLISPEEPQNNRLARVVDFREIFSLPVAYLQKHAENLGDRFRLESPYLEHFSQAFARFFMRVGLSSPIPEFK